MNKNFQMRTFSFEGYSHVLLHIAFFAVNKLVLIRESHPDLSLHAILRPKQARL